MMNKIFSTLKNNILDVYLALNILFMTGGMCAVKMNIIRLSFFSYCLMGFAVVNFIIAIILTLSKYKFHKVDLCLFFIIIFACISTIFAADIKIAIFGTPTRFEGFFVLCYYYSLFYISTFAKNKKTLACLIIFTGIIQALYCFCQYFCLFGAKPDLFNHKWVNGFTENPNFIATFMVICLSYSLGLFVDEDKKNRSFFFLICSYILFVCLLFSNTLSCLLGIIVVLFIIFIYCLKNKKYKKLVVVLLSLFSIFIFMQRNNMTILLKDFLDTGKQVADISKGNVSSEYGNDRIYVWKATFDEVPKYLLHGIGVDNFLNVKDGHAIYVVKETNKKNFIYIYDKAHNDFLQILITMGIFALISYICLYFVVLKNGLLLSTKEKNIYLLLPVIGYLVQAQFNISIIYNAPLFFMGMAFLIDRNNIYENEDNYIYRVYVKRVLDIVFSSIMIILLLPIYALISLLILLIDKDKVIFEQKRTGLNGKEFNIYKFKTMKNGKITKLGKILRTTSLDELPQFFNVLKGDMSIVGPRPWMTIYYDNFNDVQKLRNSIRPGIVGLAQVNGRNHLSIFDKISYDIYYAYNVNFILDLKILFSTINVIFIKDDVNDMDKFINKEIKILKTKGDIKMEVLLSVLNLNKRNLGKMNINSKCTIINQCNNKKKEKYKNYNIFSYKELGLSNSRNRGLEHVSEDIILLCDDDVEYRDNYESIVLDEFRKNPFADIIIFNLDSENRHINKNYKNRRLHIYNSLGFSSSNIAFRRESILNNNIIFNNLFGAGAKYSHGEDTLFIVDALKKKLKIYGVNKTIACVDNASSTWFNGYDEKFFYDKGALFACISRYFRHILMLQYLLRHRYVLDRYNIFEAYRFMRSGGKNYIKGN